MASASSRLLLLCLAGLLQAQSAENISNDILSLERLSEDDLAGLESLLDDRINLNDVSAGELWFLDDSLAAAILSAREAGPFRDWADLGRRTSLPPATIRSLREIVDIIAMGRTEGRISTRIVDHGADERIRTRLNLDGPSWSGQWVLQRDPGEYDLADLSALSVNVRRGAGELSLGTQRLNWGLGLVLADEFAAPRGETLLRPVSRLLRLRPGFSNSNLGTLHGASVELQGERSRLLAGASAQQTDITADSDGAPRIVAYRTHASPATTTREAVSYLAATSTMGDWSVGGLISNHDLQPTAETSGSGGRTYSATAAGIIHSSAGEWRVNIERALRTAQGADGPDPAASQTRLTFSNKGERGRPYLRLALIHRRYPPNWAPLRGRMMGRRVSRGNESGWFVGWHWRDTPWQTSGYLDLYRPLLAPVEGWPVEGQEWGLRVSTRIRRGEATLFTRGRNEATSVQGENQSGVEITRRQVAVTRFVSAAWSSRWTRRLTSRLIAKGNTLRGTGEAQWGGAVGGSLRYQSAEGNTGALGIFAFQTDGWDQRVTIYQYGLPGEFSLRALSGRGWRVQGRWGRALGNGVLSVRLARAWRRPETGGPGLEITSEAALQMDVAL
ncbi:MAG: hypothetical protein V3U35_05650 [Candidatus Neomarinimicrobiota bacterium]